MIHASLGVQKKWNCGTMTITPLQKRDVDNIMPQLQIHPIQCLSMCAYELCQNVNHFRQIN